MPPKSKSQKKDEKTIDLVDQPISPPKAMEIVSQEPKQPTSQQKKKVELLDPSYPPFFYFELMVTAFPLILCPFFLAYFIIAYVCFTHLHALVMDMAFFIPSILGLLMLISAQHRVLFYHGLLYYGEPRLPPVVTFIGRYKLELLMGLFFNAISIMLHVGFHIYDAEVHWTAEEFVHVVNRMTSRENDLYYALFITMIVYQMLMLALNAFSIICATAILVRIFVYECIKQGLRSSMILYFNSYFGFELKPKKE